MFLTRPHRKVPDLTNTWAMPPYVMQWVLECTHCLKPFEPVVKQYGITTVVLGLSRLTLPLISKLARDSDWAVVHLGTNHVVFLRRSGPTASLANNHAITEERFNVDEYIKRVSATDPIAASALSKAAALLTGLGWYTASLSVWQKCIEDEPGYFQASAEMARTYALRANRRLKQMVQADRQGNVSEAQRLEKKAMEDFNHAEKILQQVLREHPDFLPARKNFEMLKKQLSAFQKGIILLSK